MIHIINYIVQLVGTVLSQIFGLLPTSPIALDGGTQATIGTYAGYAAYFLPLAEARVFLLAVSGATLIWIGYRLVLRFVRVVT